MHRFKFKKRELYCENIPVSKIAKDVKTPFYLYSLNTVLDHYRKLAKAFKDLDTLICFSVKSNSNLTVLKTLVDKGSGLDIVSGGELYKALKVGTNPKKIVFASVGKTEEEIESAVKAGILLFNVETVDELDVINRVACRLNRIQKIALRINPHVQPKTHKYITTGTKENKFGLDMDVAYQLYVESYRYPFLNFCGVHLHIGSQITESKPFVKAIRKALEFVSKLKRSGIFIEYLNLGGGLGIIYSNEKPQTADQFARAVKPLLKKLNLKIILEPGRFISGNSGILVTQVLYWKSSPHKTFVIVDAGMNDLLRPSIYSAYHEIVPVAKPKNTKTKQYTHVDIVGPICESGDFLGKNREMPKLYEGDLLAVMSCGAYAFTMSSNYNARPRIAEVVVRDKKYKVARKRETYEDLIHGESVLRFK